MATHGHVQRCEGQLTCGLDKDSIPGWRRSCKKGVKIDWSNRGLYSRNGGKREVEGAPITELGIVFGD